jgi:hypothetical protein
LRSAHVYIAHHPPTDRSQFDILVFGSGWWGLNAIRSIETPRVRSSDAAESVLKRTQIAVQKMMPNASLDRGGRCHSIVVF